MSKQDRTKIFKHCLTGFTLIELLVATAVMALLFTVMTVKFRELRFTQQLQAGTRDLVSKLREVQTALLAGKILAGSEAARWYELTLTSGLTSFPVIYATKSTATTTAETVLLQTNIAIQQIYVDSLSRNQIRVRFEAPFGQISVDGSPNRIVQLQIGHKVTGQTRDVIIDGISGRMSGQ